MKPNQRKNRKPKRSKSKTGLPPGTPVYTGHKTKEDIKIDVFSYNTEKYNRYSPNIEEILAAKETGDKIWIQIMGLHDVTAIKQICDKYSVHYLYQEDILNVDQRPKVEEEDNYLYVCFKSINWDQTEKCLEEEQVSLILTQNTLISFRESYEDNYDTIRERIMSPASIIREKNIDYLFYRILDITVDAYYDIMEMLGAYIEDLEEEIMESPSQSTLVKIQSNKKDLMYLRKNLFPLRDVVNKLTFYKNPLIDSKSRKYFRDIMDHLTQNLDNVDTFIDMNMSLKDIYLNTQSNEMNKIMKILTIISTIFIPLTFIVGVYGMNFEDMPELKMKYGYYVTWLIMISIVIGLTYWFKRKKWF